MTQIFNQLINSDPGFRQEGLLTFSITAQEDRFPEDADLRRYEDEVLASLSQVAGIELVAAMASLPRGRGNPSRAYTVEGRTVAEEAERPTAGFQTVNPGYFATLEVPVVQGRGIETTDREDSQPVVVVSQAFVQREFPGEDPMGRTIMVGTEEEARVIVGVVEDVVQDRIQLAGDRGEAMYVPLAQNPLRAVSFALRVPGDPTSVAGDVRQAVWSVNPDQPVAQLRTLDDYVAESLAAMGIYGVMAHGVTQQQREIGIRMALGAGRGSVVAMITRGGLVLAGAGMLLGLPLSYLMYRGVANAPNLFGGEVGMGYAVGVTLALGGVAVLATYLPARRASGIEPVAALRD